MMGRNAKPGSFSQGGHGSWDKQEVHNNWEGDNQENDSDN